MMDDRAARAVIAAGWGLAHPGYAPTLAELQATQAVASLETGYGVWKGAGAGSNNWGAVQCCKPEVDGSCPPGTFLAGDFSSTTGRGYRVCFKSYPSPEEGAADVVRNMTAPIRPRTAAAMRTADAFAISSALYREHYYGGFHVGDPEANIREHVRALLTHAGRMAKFIGEPLALRAPPPSSPSTPDDGGALVGVSLFAAAGLLAALARR